MPNIFKYLPKRWIFAKSGHTAYKQRRQQSAQKGDKHGGTYKLKKKTYR